MANTLGGLNRDSYVQCTDKDGQISALCVKTGSVSAQVSVGTSSFTFTSNGKDLSAAYAEAATSADSAGKLSSARKIVLQDSAGINSGTAASFDGAADLTVKLPAALCCTVLGNASTATSATHSVSADNAKNAAAAAKAATAASAAQISVGSLDTACLKVGSDSYVLSSASLALADGTSFEGMVFVKKA